jgi:hypothetical protein
MLKAWAKRMLQVTGRELCGYSKFEIEDARRIGWDLRSLNYKDFQVARAYASAGHITIEEARFLSALVERTAPEDPIIEIGTLFGFSTTTLSIAKHKAQELITVDKYAWNPHGISATAHELATKQALRDACSNHAVTMIRQDKDDFYTAYKGRAPGLFFCDADHDYEPTLRDLTWAQKVKAKIICGHDYDPVRFPGVVRAVKELGGPSELVGSVFVL